LIFIPALLILGNYLLVLKKEMHFILSGYHLSIFFEFIPKLFVALAFDFILYVTGAGVLNLISFGSSKHKLHSYNEYKGLKGKSKNIYLVPYVMGILFYVLIIVLIALLN